MRPGRSGVLPTKLSLDGGLDGAGWDAVVALTLEVDPTGNGKGDKEDKGDNGDCGADDTTSNAFGGTAGCICSAGF